MHAYLPIHVIDRYRPLMVALGVSAVARGPRGFLRAYRDADGNPAHLSEWWRARREAFIKRHMAQVKKREEPLWKNGEPTRRHLALIAWGFSPYASRL